MARIQILNLPGDGNPFAVIIDQFDSASMAVGKFIEADAAHLLGARALLGFEETIEIVGQAASETTQAAADPNGELYYACENQRDDARQGLTDLRARLSQLADNLDADAISFGGSKCHGWMEAAAQIRAALDGAVNST